MRKHLNNYKEKSGTFAKQNKNEGSVMLAYREFGVLFDKFVTSGSNKALDFGAGTGGSRKFLEKMGFEADGVDIDSDMVEKAKTLDEENKDKYQLIVDSTIPHRASKYDLTFSTMVVLEIGSKEELVNYFSEAYRVMKFDGTFIVLTVNDDFYKHQWLSIDTDYPGNKEATSGSKVKIKIKEIDLELNDFYWTKEDYRQIAEQVGFSILQEVEPKGTNNDGVEWISEQEYAPFVIFVMKKTKALENKTSLSDKYNLNIKIPGRGNFTEISRDQKIVTKENLPEGFSGDRNASAAIKLLMTPGDFWPFHRLKSAETFTHVEGNDLIIHCLSDNGLYSKIYLGEENDGAVKNYTIPADCWYAEEVAGKNGYCLIEAETTPGFHPDDQIEAKREELLKLINPQNIELINLVERFHPFDRKYTSKNVNFASDSPLMNNSIVDKKSKNTDEEIKTTKFDNL